MTPKNLLNSFNDQETVNNMNLNFSNFTLPKVFADESTLLYNDLETPLTKKNSFDSMNFKTFNSSMSFSNFSKLCSRSSSSNNLNYDAYKLEKKLSYNNFGLNSSNNALTSASSIKQSREDGYLKKNPSQLINTSSSTTTKSYQSLNYSSTNYKSRSGINSRLSSSSLNIINHNKIDKLKKKEQKSSVIHSLIADLGNKSSNFDLQSTSKEKSNKTTLIKDQKLFKEINNFYGNNFFNSFNKSAERKNSKGKQINSIDENMGNKLTNNSRKLSDAIKSPKNNETDDEILVYSTPVKYNMITNTIISPSTARRNLLTIFQQVHGK